MLYIQAGKHKNHEYIESQLHGMIYSQKNLVELRSLLDRRHVEMNNSGGSRTRTAAMTIPGKPFSIRSFTGISHHTGETNFRYGLFPKFVLRNIKLMPKLYTCCFFSSY